MAIEEVNGRCDCFKKIEAIKAVMLDGDYVDLTKNFEFCPFCGRNLYVTCDKCGNVKRGDRT